MGRGRPSPPDKHLKKLRPHRSPGGGCLRTLVYTKWGVLTSIFPVANLSQPHLEILEGPPSGKKGQRGRQEGHGPLVQTPGTGGLADGVWELSVDLNGLRCNRCPSTAPTRTSGEDFRFQQLPPGQRLKRSPGRGETLFHELLSRIFLGARQTPSLEALSRRL